MKESLTSMANKEAKKKVFGVETVESETDQGRLEMTKNTFIEKALTMVGLKSLAEQRKAKRLKPKQESKSDKKERTIESSDALINKSEKQTEINTEGLDEEKKALVKKLQSAKQIANTTVSMARFADPAEAFASLFPGLGDGGASTSLGIFYHALGVKVGFDKKQHASITRIMLKDFAAGLIPVVGDIADFLYKGCKKVGRLFDKHFKNLMKEAEGKLSPEILKNIKDDKSVDAEMLKKAKNDEIKDLEKSINKEDIW